MKWPKNMVSTSTMESFSNRNKKVPSIHRSNSQLLTWFIGIEVVTSLICLHLPEWWEGMFQWINWTRGILSKWICLKGRQVRTSIVLGSPNLNWRTSLATTKVNLKRNNIHWVNSILEGNIVTAIKMSFKVLPRWRKSVHLTRTIMEE